MKRSAGILCPIFSLPSNYGIGTLGQSAYDFIDFLSDSNQTYWQILPIGSTGYGDSPYQSFSIYAGNPYFIDLDELIQEDLLKKEEVQTLEWGTSTSHIEYNTLYDLRFKVLKIAVKRFLNQPTKDYIDFCQKESNWLIDYSLFMSIKQYFNGKPFLEWPISYRLKEEGAIFYLKEELKDEIEFWKVCQYFFFQQYFKLKDYANSKGIQIIGDIPIYVALDSVDVWSNPELFQLDSMRQPIDVAGCPPDGFSADGQLWGNPLFRWDVMEKDQYAWWIQRIKHQLRFVDVLRIDHFRGFESYYSIPFGSKNARHGVWEKGPGYPFFEIVKNQVPNAKIIAEDLGFLTDEVIELVKQCGFPGMKILQFAFDSRDTGSGYLPHMYIHNSVAYTGTHDNDTIVGWYTSCASEDREFANQYLNINSDQEIHWQMIRAILASVSNLAIIPIQDYLGYNSNGRINIPSTTGNNWTWRLKQDELNETLSSQIADMTRLYGR